MLLILRSRAAFSLLSGSFGSLRFFSLGTSLARGWRGQPAPVSSMRLARIFRNGRRSLRKRVRATDQNHQCYREDRFPHPGSPVSIFYRVGASIVAQLRRPWAAQSCAFRTSAMVPSNQIPAATSTTKNPSITAFSTPRLPPSSGGSRFPSPSSSSLDHGFGG